MHKVALIDDHKDTRELLAVFLSFDPELAVTSFPSADAALQALRAGTTFDLIISDISMPGTDGIEFVRILREELGNVHIPAIAVTAHAADYYIHAARAAGFNEYLIKPVDLPDLSDQVRKLLTPLASRTHVSGDALPSASVRLSPSPRSVT
jgi:CheY-like chemotaxis protein